MPEKPDLQENLDLTDPTVLIVRTLLDNVAITKDMMTESKMARQAMAESMRKTTLQADTTAAAIRSLTITTQQLVREQEALRHSKWDCYIWAAAGFILGAVAMGSSLTMLPALWQQIFG